MLFCYNRVTERVKAMNELNNFNQNNVIESERIDNTLLKDFLSIWTHQKNGTNLYKSIKTIL